MSRRYKGARISATPPTTTGGESGTASGAWTLQSQNQAQAAGLWPSQPLPKYIEDVFSTYLYTGTGANRSITNDIDLSGNGGLVWVKERAGASSHYLADTVRGATKVLFSDSTSEQLTVATSITGFSGTGFSLGTAGGLNGSGQTYASWTFRKQPKFFDVVTYTGDGTDNRAISHNLGSAPKFIIIKCTSDAGTNWVCGMTGVGTSAYTQLILNSTDAGVDRAYDGSGMLSAAPTSTTFSINQFAFFNGSGRTYVAYLFAHNAGGFGLTGTENVISCGSFTADGSGLATINLGYEPQWVMYKRTDSSASGSWFIVDIMRGFDRSGINFLTANTSNAETPTGAKTFPNAIGFNFEGAFNGTYIYIAIRRGPMKVPTTGTQVFNPTKSNAANGTAITTNFVVDSQWINYLSGTPTNTAFNDRLRGVSTTATESGRYLVSSSTAAEATTLSYTNKWGNTGYLIPSATAYDNAAYYSFSRAPSFFDEVCTNGDASGNLSFTHNLGATPELVIMKARASVGYLWYVYCANAPQPLRSYSALSDTYAFSDSGLTYYAPTSTTFQTFQGGWVPNNGTAVVYLFATCPGVSKVGGYTGTGTTQTINCGFVGGARWVMVKRTDSTGDWYVWDTARGMVSGTDPSLLLNSTAAEVNANSVYTIATGFQIVSTAAGINASGGSYIFLAIA